LTVAVALAVLTGWAIGNQRLTTIVTGLVAMNPLTATCFILSAAALLIWPTVATSPRPWQPVVLASLVGLCGLARLCGYLFDWNVPLDRLLFSSRLALHGGLPNRMAPNTALNFCLIGLAILLLALKRVRLAQFLVLGAALAAFVTLVGYAYSLTSLVRIAAFIPMALHTAILFLLIAGAVLCAAPEAGPMAAITSGSPGGRVIRRMLPTLILAPPLLGWLRLQGELAGLYGPSFGVASIAGAMVAMGVGLTWVTARAVDVGEAERRRAEEITLRMAHFDNLTGLPNRTLLDDRLRQALARARRSKGMVALLFLDLDGFKLINDALGHDAGDQALKEAAERIRSALRMSDTAARLGGDEFIVVLEQITSEDDVRAVGRRLLSLLSQPYSIAGVQAKLSASVGVSLYPTHSQHPAELMHLADTAMYSAKRAGKNQIAFHGR
jgi:diguanylate cyclase (GGDEF)-like protein